MASSAGAGQGRRAYLSARRAHGNSAGARERASVRRAKRNYGRRYVYVRATRARLFTIHINLRAAAVVAGAGDYTRGRKRRAPLYIYISRALGAAAVSAMCHSRQRARSRVMNIYPRLLQNKWVTRAAKERRGGGGGGEEEKARNRVIRASLRFPLSALPGHVSRRRDREGGGRGEGEERIARGIYGEIKIFRPISPASSTRTVDMTPRIARARFPPKARILFIPIGRKSAPGERPFTVRLAAHSSASVYEKFDRRG